MSDVTITGINTLQDVLATVVGLFNDDDIDPMLARAYAIALEDNTNLDLSAFTDIAYLWDEDEQRGCGCVVNIAARKCDDCDELLRPITAEEFYARVWQETVDANGLINKAKEGK